MGDMIYSHCCDCKLLIKENQNLGQSKKNSEIRKIENTLNIKLREIALGY